MGYSNAAMIRLKCGLAVADISDADLISLEALADEEIERTTNQKYSSANSVTEYLSVYLPKRADDVRPNRILLGHYPIQAISGFTLIDYQNTAYATLDTLSAAEVTSGTWQSADYYCDINTGIIELTTRSFDFVPRRAKIQYYYGYSGISGPISGYSGPIIISELSACLAGIRALVKFLGGNYNYLNSYSLPEQSYNKGDLYDRGQKIVDQLTKNAEDLFAQIGKKHSSQIFVTSAGYYE